ncbi:ABC transporter permease [Oricola sp.]|uniref:ABC transporter permease n=1 Tax=Oricola sp. TaxID=1979950 RepID=UPI003BAA5978
MNARQWDRLQSLAPLVGAVLLVLAGSFFYPKFLSAGYLLQQLQIASFLGVIAAGSMIVILLGQIDLSIPWTLTGAAIISTSLAGTGDPTLTALAIPGGLFFGAFIGAVNGVGVAILRIPAMVWTLAVNAMLLGVAVLNTGGFNPKGEASPLMIELAAGRLAGIPIAAEVWFAVSVLALLLLHRTTFGRYLIAIGNSEKATYLSGVDTFRVVILAFVISGTCSALGGIMLAGYANQAYQSMGDPYLMPVIAAVVIGGTSILGGSGSYVGTVSGVLFITVLTSILSIMQLADAWRQIIFGGIILMMLLMQGLRPRLHSSSS